MDVFGLRESLAAFVEDVREYPVAAPLEHGTLAASIVLAALTVVLFVAQADPNAAPVAWILVVALGATVVLLWTVLVPLLERVR